MAWRWSSPSHYLNKCWNTVNLNLRKKLQWNLKRNSYIFIQEMHLKMLSAKWWQFCLSLNVLTTLFMPTCFKESCLYVICMVPQHWYEDPFCTTTGQILFLFYVIHMQKIYWFRYICVLILISSSSPISPFILSAVIIQNQTHAPLCWWNVIYPLILLLHWHYQLDKYQRHFCYFFHIIRL